MSETDEQSKREGPAESRHRWDKAKVTRVVVGVSERAARILNAPFVIAVVSGIFLSWWTHTWKIHEQRQAVMRSFMIRFADEYSKVFDIAPTLETVYLRYGDSISVVKSMPVQHGGRYQKAFAEKAKAKRQYARERRKWESLESPIALDNDAELIFASAAVHEDMQEMNKWTMQIITNPNKEAFWKFYEKAQALYWKSLQDMRLEIRG